MGKRLLYTIFCLIIIVFMTSCHHRVGEVPDAMPSVYYWKTTFSISKAQFRFLSDNGIKKIYLRLFDVVPSSQGPVPNATISFRDTVPSSFVIVPTIFIDYTLFRSTTDPEQLAHQVVSRVTQMSKTHSFDFNEIQFDCDWTVSTESAYFTFLQTVKNLAPNLRVSATIRLHQLSLTPPPVHYGTLMLYNTGDFRDFSSTRNPILDIQDVAPYLRYLSAYQLPLCVAYPNFEWKLLFHDGNFNGILYQEDLSDTTMYLPSADNSFLVIIPHDIPVAKGKPNVHLAPGDVVKYWKTDPVQLQQVHKMVESKRPGIHNQTIIYHLSAIE